jgi:hypothetical protein
MVLEMPVSNGEPGAATRGERFASDVIAAPSENRRRGEGAAMAEASFRDPPDVETQGAELQRAIARALVNAPTLPIDLPAFDLTLLAVAAEKRAIDLVLGKTSPIAKLRLQAAAAGVRDAPGASAVVDVSIIEVHPSMRRFEPGLRAMAQRLRAAINGEKWRRAADYAQQLARIPLGVPIAFYRPRLSGLWFLPWLLWLTPSSNSHGETWRIVLALVVVAIVAARTVFAPEAPALSRAGVAPRPAAS